mgnify:CR=1 FL=1
MCLPEKMVMVSCALQFFSVNASSKMQFGTFTYFKGYNESFKLLR